MMREERQSRILEIIAREEIETQEELCEALARMHYSVTQATVSRDIKQLRLHKVRGSDKKYRYAYMSEKKEEKLPLKMRNLFRETVVSIRCAKNIVVIKTLSGSASNAGAVLDSINKDEVVGTVAGDDTMFAACISDEAARIVAEELNELLR